MTSFHQQKPSQHRRTHHSPACLYVNLVLLAAMQCRDEGGKEKTNRNDRPWIMTGENDIGIVAQSVSCTFVLYVCFA